MSEYQTTINVTLSNKASSFLTREVKRKKRPISEIMSSIIEEYRDLKEDFYFSKLAEKVESETTCFCSHEEAWGKKE